jgi:hypothetical protein
MDFSGSIQKNPTFFPATALKYTFQAATETIS